MKILKFTAIWCSSCLYMNNQLDKIKDKLNDIEIVSYDYDEDKDLVNEWGVEDILPVLIFIDKDGNEIKRLIGERNKDQILEIINNMNGSEKRG